MLLKTLKCILLTLVVYILISSCTKSVTGSSSYFGSSNNYFNTGSPKFDSIVENPFVKTSDSTTSTFSIDADGASYTAMRKWLFANGDLTQVSGSIRSEEFVNYFTYDYPDPVDGNSIAVNGEVSSCPWNTGNKLIRIGIKGKSVATQNYPFANFVLLIDVSGSMQSNDKLQLLKTGFIQFAQQMRPQDKLAIVVYAGASGLVLDATSGTEKSKIIDKINSLTAGGSTNGSAGINLAYEIAEKNFIQGGNNRVILGTDGDFNVGVTNSDDLVKLIESKRDKGIFLTTLGVGMDNLNDHSMEQIADHGNGNYEFLDNSDQVTKVFINEYNKFLTVAKDVKVQITFDTSLVEEYRLIGYENRMLQQNDFTNDAKDAGEIGAGQTITALYEIKPKASVHLKEVPTFKIDFRYKKPDENISNALALDVFDQGSTFAQASENMRFASSLAALGLYIRKSDYKGSVTLQMIKDWAKGAVSFDPFGYRKAHLTLLDKLK